MEFELQVGSRFSSYRELITILNQYCFETNTKFWKRHTKTLKSKFDSNLPANIRRLLVYYEIDFVCSKNGFEALKEDKNECPAYFRFKLSEEGMYLELIAMNDRHNHTSGDNVDLSLKRKADDQPYEITLGKIIKNDEDVEIIEVHIDKSEEDSDVTEQSVASELTPSDNMAKFTFRGLIAPTLTPFNDDLSLNLDVIQDYAKFLADSKIMGILVNGTSGEGMSMSVQERKLITEEWVKAVKKTNQHLMVQIGGAPLPDVLELARHAESVGVHSLLCLPDLYFKPKTSSDLIRYLKIVGAAAPNTPLLYYHIPMFTDVNIPMGEFLNKVPGKIPTFRGIKFTSNDMDDGVAATKANGGQYAIFLGADQIMAGAYTLGFDSAIATTVNMFPKLTTRILEAVQKSQVVEARKAQDILTKVCSVVTQNGTWVPTMKVAMNLYSPIKVGKVREPLVNLTEDQIKEMQEEMRHISFDQ